ncbi:MAG: acyl-CoA thioesterase [Acidobacteriota bacterium]
MSEAKTVKQSQARMTQLVLPDETNQLGNLLGGQLMHWIDLVAAIAAMRHARKVCVTASVDEINFINPVKQGEVVTLLASVNRVFTTSMEIGVSVSAENLLTGETHHTNSAYLTFVAIDEQGRPVPVDPIVCEDDGEIRRFNEALHRRELRLQRRIK